MLRTIAATFTRVCTVKKELCGGGGRTWEEAKLGSMQVLGAPGTYASHLYSLVGAWCLAERTQGRPSNSQVPTSWGQRGWGFTLILVPASS